MVQSLRAHHDLRDLLKAAGLAQSTFYYHLARLDRPDPDAELKAAIRVAFEEAKGRYGHRRIRTVLGRAGWAVSKKKVHKLMGILGLVCKVRPKKYRSYKGETGKIAPNLLTRDFEATEPNQKWASDVTEFHIGADKLYFSPVIDLFDGMIVAHSLSLSPSVDFATESLAEAVATLEEGKRRPIVHTDQGFQYQHARWRKILEDSDCTQSMSRKGNCLDNACAESFFSHLKEEMFTHDHHDSVDELAADIVDYVQWYNAERIHTRLGDLSPIEYREQALAA